VGTETTPTATACYDPAAMTQVGRFTIWAAVAVVAIVVIYLVLVAR
jgi:hypothetical protein